MPSIKLRKQMTRHPFTTLVSAVEKNIPFLGQLTYTHCYSCRKPQSHYEHVCVCVCVHGFPLHGSLGERGSACAWRFGY